ncbi:MAG: hypothetical protein IPN76_21915 [Saprospiraceae bacterium]|nr:hypothetical protein [Saprospiraceae bacterium]
MELTCYSFSYRLTDTVVVSKMVIDSGDIHIPHKIPFESKEIEFTFSIFDYHDSANNGVYYGTTLSDSVWVSAINDNFKLAGEVLKEGMNIPN